MSERAKGDRRGLLQLRAALLPVFVAAIAIPIVAAFLTGGPPAGLAAGALAAAVVIVVAARAHPETPIEVAPSAGDRARLLVVIDRAIEEPDQAQAVARAIAEGEVDGETEPEVLIVAPALNSPLAHWLSDVDAARLDAQRRLVLSLGSLAAAGLDARGEVGDPDPLQAAEDALRRFAADRVGVWGDDARASELCRTLASRLAIPVSRLT